MNNSGEAASPHRISDSSLLFLPFSYRKHCLLSACSDSSAVLAWNLMMYLYDITASDHHLDYTMCHQLSSQVVRCKLICVTFTVKEHHLWIMKHLVNYFEGKEFSSLTQRHFCTFCHQFNSGNMEAMLLPRQTIIHNLKRKTARSCCEGTYSEWLYELGVTASH